MWIIFSIVYVVMGLIFTDVMTDYTVSQKAERGVWIIITTWVIATLFWPLLIVVRLTYRAFQKLCMWGT